MRPHLVFLAKCVGVVATFFAGWHAYECNWVLVGILFPIGAVSLWFGLKE